MIDRLKRPTALRRAGLLVLSALLASLLAACAGTSISQIVPAAPTAIPTAMPTSAPAPTSVPTPDVAPTAAPAAAAPAASAAAAGSDDAAVQAIKKVIQQANQEQVQAVAAHDPAPMRDTATSSYYTQAAQGLDDLLSSGVTAIELVDLKWGPITLQAGTAAQATTVETWRTTFADTSTTQEADTNVYSLVLESGAWKVQDDQHPDAQLLQPPQDSPGAAPAPAAPSAPGEMDQSRNWAGYAATGGDFTAVSGSWTVPTVSAGRTPAADATWVGIGGISSRDLIQAGTDASVQSGRVVYTAWIEMLPQASQQVPLVVHAGDKVSVSITQQSSDTWQIQIRNTTTGKSYQKTVTYASSRSSAEWIEEAPAAGGRVIIPLDNFGTVKLSDATTVEDGQQRTITQAGGQPITMADRTGQPIAQPSALGSDGASFSVSRSGTRVPRSVPGSAGVSGQVLTN